MRVQRVLVPDTEVESWTLLGDDHVLVEPVERFLAYLASIEKSPNTIKVYAHDLKDWLTYVEGHRLDWRAATLEDVAGFVAWLRLPPQARDGKVAVLPTVEHHCSAASVNRKLAALTSFCEFHARQGIELAGLLVTMQPAGRRICGQRSNAFAPGGTRHRRACLFPTGNAPPTPRCCGGWSPQPNASGTSNPKTSSSARRSPWRSASAGQPTSSATLATRRGRNLQRSSDPADDRVNDTVSIESPLASTTIISSAQDKCRVAADDGAVFGDVHG